MDARHLTSSMKVDRFVTFDNALARNERDDPACPLMGDAAYDRFTRC